ncbi:MAG: hypothetical protein H8E18_09685 [FCB group bacterium]|nr:hypothetical protein [FCB group bacterium]
MTRYNPELLLERLVVFTSGGEVAYDESFHEGVNILRGHNSSGKSTIANFIYFSLGGDFKKWTSAAQLCSDVYAEVRVNSESITTRRMVAESGNQPMDIYWGSYEEAIQSGSEGWQKLSYRRTNERKSFSNALFLALGLPELRGDLDSNITMHQLLRLMYIDQKSMTHDLFMSESFDSAITRKTVADLLFGVYDDTLYSDKIELKEAEKDFTNKNKQFDGIERIFKSIETETDPAVITALINKNDERILQIESYLANNQYPTPDENGPNETEELQIVSLKRKLITQKSNLSILQSKIDEYEYEISDSMEFIASLEKRTLALSDSLLTRDTFVDLKMNLCPSCLAPLQAAPNENHCGLCKQNMDEDQGSSRIKRMEQEIDNQLRESKKLLSDKEHLLLEYKSSYPTLELSVREIQSELNEALNSATSSRDEQLDSLLIEKGELKSKNDYLVLQMQAIEQIDVLRKELAELKYKITLLQRSIRSKESGQRRRLQSAYSLLQDYTLKLLHSDLGRQAEFQQGGEVQLDFDKNTFSLDGENNFSESSNVYLKNSVRFSIFFASLEEEYFRYPRFILCDNIEDKGMEPIRSQSFQKELVKLSSDTDVDHQIIITTSMIDPELDNSSLCVGEFYTEENMTLRLS